MPPGSPLGPRGSAEATRGSTATARGRFGPGAAGAVLLVAGLLAYANSLHGPFVHDDGPAILRNATIRSLWPLHHVLSPPAGPAVTHRPILNFSLAVNYALGGTDVVGYHIVNLAIHLLAALLLFGVLRRTFLSPRVGDRVKGSATGLAFSIALLWELHPIQTEAVTYIIQRAESLMGLFFLLALYAAVRGGASVRPLSWYVLSWASYALAMGTKEAAFALPLIVLVHDRLLVFESLGELLRRRWGLHAGLVAVAVVALILHLGGGLRSATATLDRPTAIPYACTQLCNIVHYLRLSIWPSPLILDYGRELIRGAGPIVVCGALVGLLGVATALALFRAHPLGLVGVWFFAILAPSSSILPLNQPTVEHRMYLPLAAVITLVLVGALWLWGRRPSGPKRVLVAVVLLAALLGAATHVRNRDYQDDLVLWHDTVRKRPDNPLAHLGLGLVLAERGDCRSALAEYSVALARRPDDLGILLPMADAHNRCKDPAAALLACDRALRLGATSAAVYESRGWALQELGEPWRAIEDFSRAIEREPGNARLYFLRGVAFSDRDERASAIQDFSRAIALDPTDGKAYHNRGDVYYAEGRLEEAIADVTRAIDHPEQRLRALHNRAVCCVRRGLFDQAWADVESIRQAGGKPDEELVRQLGQVRAR